jgi:hypothetical protein
MPADRFTNRPHPMPLEVVARVSRIMETPFSLTF